MVDGATHLECFKAYDVRGRVPDELNAEMAELIGLSYAHMVRARRVVVGRDIRLTGGILQEALCKGLTARGVEVVDIGVVGTEEVYFATWHLGTDGGVMVTASHNPSDYNGMKFVRKDARPISADTGLKHIEAMVAAALAEPQGRGHLMSGHEGAAGSVTPRDSRQEYVTHLMTHIDRTVLRPLKLVVNAGNGCAGPVIDVLEESLPLEFVKVHHTPDGSFPNGVPNPLLPENREATAAAVRESRADLGIAWDGDFDRCFFFDENGEFVDGYYLVGLLAQRALERFPGAKIIHDPRLVWNTLEIVESLGGVPVMCKSGHAFIKERMREEQAVYGGEMSAHHYFRDFSYCDSGMIPWLQIIEIMSRSGKKFSELVGRRMRLFPISGEINLTLDDPADALARLRDRFGPAAKSVDETDGLSIEYPEWRCNVRMSNTEPVVRINLETRADHSLVTSKTQEVIACLEGRERVGSAPCA